MATNRKLMLRACTRCGGDLLHDERDQEYVCIQCGRRADVAVLHQVLEPVKPVTPATREVLAA